ncbi:hypothetical protein [Streptomyces sp. NPDC051569]|uniref:hypothetical protein n=1 Tax=Streptomyces sp. NPDC051569 TaxID=3365661 RepID=UPI0037938E55
MPDRRRRTALHLPQPAGPVLLPRERQSPSTGPPGSSGSSGPSGSSGSTESSGPPGSSESPGSSGPSDDNPFAPPPEGAPDQPWRPRHQGNGGSPDGRSSGSDQDRDGDRGAWGGQWSSRQPGRSTDGFGSRLGGRNGPNGPSGQNGRNGQGGDQEGPEGSRGTGLRWDPTDPAQRRARYALLSGMWAFFFALFTYPEVALLLGSLAVYWGVSSLRNKPRKSPSGQDKAASGGPQTLAAQMARTAQSAQRDPAPVPAPVQAQMSGRQRTTAAVSGLVTAGLALTMVAGMFTMRLAYRDYYTCLDDALTKSGQLSCNELLPHSLEPYFGVKE